MTETELKKWVEFTPAFDLRDPDPAKNCGVHGAEMKFLLKGEKGVVQFLVYTNWHLPHVRAEEDVAIIRKAKEYARLDSRIRTLKVSGHGLHSEDIQEIMSTVKSLFEDGTPVVNRPLDLVDLKVRYHPMPADLGVHSLTPLFEGQAASGSEWVDMKAAMRNLESAREADRLGIEPEVEEICLPTGVTDPCPYLDGRPCYYDGSGLNAIPLFEKLVSQGSDAVWKEMEEYYERKFYPSE